MLRSEVVGEVDVVEEEARAGAVVSGTKGFNPLSRDVVLVEVFPIDVVLINVWVNIREAASDELTHVEPASVRSTTDVRLERRAGAEGCV